MAREYRPVFHDVDDDWRERWTLIRSFIREWYATFDFPNRESYQINPDFPRSLYPVGTWDAVAKTEAANARLIKEMKAEFERNSRFGRYRIFESIDRIAILNENQDKEYFKVQFPNEIDFTTLPDWLIQNSDDHRIPRS